MIFKKSCAAIFLFTFISIIAEAQTEKRILIVGDSLTEGYGVSKISAYPHQLELLLKKKSPNIKVINAGTSGSTSASAVSRLRWHLKKKPHLLILALGGNDGLRGTKLSATKQNLEKAIQLAKKNNVLVYLAGMKLPMNYGPDYRASFEKLFRELIQENHIKEIPFLLQGVGGQKGLNLPDGIHPNEKGHLIIAKTIYKIIENDI